MNENASCIVEPTDMEPSISVMVLAFAADPVARWAHSLARPSRPERHGALRASASEVACLSEVTRCAQQHGRVAGPLQITQSIFSQIHRRSRQTHP
jgi:hypothetical protein